MTVLKCFWNNFGLWKVPKLDDDDDDDDDGNDDYDVFFFIQKGKKVCFLPLRELWCLQVDWKSNSTPF